MYKNLVIIGASVHEKVVADIEEGIGYKQIAFLDDNVNITACGKYQVFGVLESRNLYRDEDDFSIVIGNDSIKERIYNLLDKEVSNLVPLIHPSTTIAQDARIDKGTVVMAGTVINSDTLIGNGVIIYTNSSVDHENYIDSFSHISVGSHLAGNVKIGRNSWIRMGSIVKNNLTIASNVTTDVGDAVITVIKDIEEKGECFECLALN